MPPFLFSAISRRFLRQRGTGLTSSRCRILSERYDLAGRVQAVIAPVKRRVRKGDAAFAVLSGGIGSTGTAGYFHFKYGQRLDKLEADADALNELALQHNEVLTGRISVEQYKSWYVKRGVHLLHQLGEIGADDIEAAKAEVAKA